MGMLLPGMGSCSPGWGCCSPDWDAAPWDGVVLPGLGCCSLDWDAAPQIGMLLPKLGCCSPNWDAAPRVRVPLPRGGMQFHGLGTLPMVRCCPWSSAPRCHRGSAAHGSRAGAGAGSAQPWGTRGALGAAPAPRYCVPAGRGAAQCGGDEGRRWARAGGQCPVARRAVTAERRCLRHRGRARDWAQPVGGLMQYCCLNPGAGGSPPRWQQPGSALPHPALPHPGAVLPEPGCICPVRGASRWPGSSGDAGTQLLHGSAPALGWLKPNQEPCGEERGRLGGGLGCRLPTTSPRWHPSWHPPVLPAPVTAVPARTMSLQGHGHGSWGLASWHGHGDTESRGHPTAPRCAPGTQPCCPEPSALQSCRFLPGHFPGSAAAPGAPRPPAA
ncbi:uncharacterized protein LOC121058525 isoform X2 [Cygnus olor]|uniref:uncharacterized protein LOC121058525 isoform X2 n=2 Tax=Cygnus olor TaxID=8869 RepID=UPI001ADDEC6C|nr:uncharacterized protein LOC121058525 isoform X2 [Cygnus olor]